MEVILSGPVTQTRLPPLQSMLPYLLSTDGPDETRKFTAKQEGMLAHLADSMTSYDKLIDSQITQETADFLCQTLLRQSAFPKHLALDIIRTVNLVLGAATSLQKYQSMLFSHAVGLMQAQDLGTGTRRLGFELAGSIAACHKVKSHMFNSVGEAATAYAPLHLESEQKPPPMASASGTPSSGPPNAVAPDLRVPPSSTSSTLATQSVEAAGRVMISASSSDFEPDRKLQQAASMLLATMAWCVGEVVRAADDKGGNGVKDASIALVRAASSGLQAMREAPAKDPHAESIVRLLLMALGTVCHWSPDARQLARSKGLQSDLQSFQTTSIATSEQVQSSRYSSAAGSVDKPSDGSVYTSAAGSAYASVASAAGQSDTDSSEQAAGGASLQEVTKLRPSSSRQPRPRSLQLRFPIPDLAEILMHSLDMGTDPAGAPLHSDTVHSAAPEATIGREASYDGAVRRAFKSDAPIPGTAHNRGPPSSTTECAVADSHKPMPPPQCKDPQGDFDRARRMVPMNMAQEQDRWDAIKRVCDEFRRDAVEAANQMPALLGLAARHPAAQSGAGGDTELPTIAGKEKLTSAVAGGMEYETYCGVTIVDAGGIAGGAKAIHAKHGLFLKTPEADSIYGSEVMAAKVMKLEMKAARWVHELDSILINGVLTTVVDVPYERKDGKGRGVQRVQVQARVPVSDATLRYGSSDGGVTIHIDKEQECDSLIVERLSDQFWLAPMGQAGCKQVVLHSYNAMKCEAPKSYCWLDDMKSKGLDVSELEEAYIPGDLSDETLESFALMFAVDLSPQYEEGTIQHSTRVISAAEAADHGIPTKDGFVLHQLPFDVEIHQLPSGQRVVLDTHRLLMPDLAWIRWMKYSDEAKPTVWAVGSEAGVYHSGHLDAFLHWPSEVTLLDESDASQYGLAKQLAEAVMDWAKRLRIAKPDASCTIHSLHRGAGIVLLTSDCPTKGRVVYVVSCPRWYWGDVPSLTCMMPPEAAKKADSGGSFEPGVSPDCTLRAGASADRVMLERLGEVTSRIASPDALAKFANDLRRVTTPLGYEGKKLNYYLAEKAKSQSPMTMAWDVLYQLRGKIKASLRASGLSLRHVGMVDLIARTRGLPQIPASVLVASCLPSSGSVSGTALDVAIRSASSLVGPSQQLMVHAACMSARAFAARGIGCLFGTDADVRSCLDRVYTEEEQSVKPGWMLQQYFHNVLSEHSDQMLGCVPSNSKSPGGVVGMYESRKKPGYGDGAVVTYEKEYSADLVAMTFAELAHVQRVGGTTELELLVQLGQCGWQGSAHWLLGTRALVRAMSVMRLRSDDTNRDPASIQGAYQYTISRLVIAKLLARLGHTNAATWMLEGPSPAVTGSTGRSTGKTIGGEATISWEARQELVRLYAMTGRFEDALGVARVAVGAPLPDCEPETRSFVKSQYLACFCAERTGMDQSAMLAEFQRRLEPIRSRLQEHALAGTERDMCRGLLLARIGQSDVALAMLGAVTQQDHFKATEPSLQIAALRARGDCFVHKENHTEALGAYLEAMLLLGPMSPARAQIVLSAAECYKQLGLMEDRLNLLYRYREGFHRDFKQVCEDYFQVVLVEVQAHADKGDISSAQEFSGKALGKYYESFGIRVGSKIFVQVAIAAIAFAMLDGQPEPAEAYLEAVMPAIAQRIHACMADLGQMQVVGGPGT